MKKEIYNNLESFIQSILLSSEGWLVGGAPEAIINGSGIKDYDIIVPSRELFQTTCAMLRTLHVGVDNNTFGGLKYKFDLVDDQKEESVSIEVDIWCEELDHFIKTANKFKYAYNLKKNILIQNI